MKITIVTAEYNLDGGGLAFQCREFVNILTKIGHKISVLNSHPTNVITGGYNKSLGYELAMEEKLKLDSHHCSTQDLIIAFGGGMNGYYASQLAQKNQKRLWIMFRGSDANLCKWNLSRYDMNIIACNQAESVICLSNEIRDNLISIGVCARKIQVIPNSANMVKNVRCDFQNSIILGTGATNLNEKKGVVRLIKMVAHYNRRHSQRKVYLEFAGHVDDDYLKQFKAIAEAEHVEDYISFLGKVDRSVFINLLTHWNIFIQASICEGMGNAATEAMSVGCPILISDTGYIAELARHSCPKVLFTSLSPEDMALSLERVLNSTDIEDEYRRFYDIFFEQVSPLNIEEKWNTLLDYIKPICSVTVPPQSIFSVSLHDVSGDMHDHITTPIQVFEKFVNDIHNSGYVLCSMAQYLSTNENERSNHIVCTFDDGYEGLLTNALPLMNKFGFSATVFVCTDYLGKANNWNLKDKARRKHLDIPQLRQLKENGWEIGSHGVTHESLLKLNDEEIKTQLGESKRILENIFGPIRTYAYPYGDYSPFIEKQVKKYYESAFLLMQGGVYLAVDAHRIHRYYISEIYEIINSK